jgi:hypothetical protein
LCAARPIGAHRSCSGHGHSQPVTHR